jgi:hypothetical protein
MEPKGARWTGRAVAERNERKRFAKLIIDDPEHRLSPHHKRFSVTASGCCVSNSECRPAGGIDDVQSPVLPTESPSVLQMSA